MEAPLALTHIFDEVCQTGDLEGMQSSVLAVEGSLQLEVAQLSAVVQRFIMLRSEIAPFDEHVLTHSLIQLHGQDLQVALALSGGNSFHVCESLLELPALSYKYSLDN